VELRLRPKRERNLFEFGEPVHVELKRKNTSKREREVHDIAHPTTGVTEILIKLPNGEVTVFRPSHRICIEDNRRVLHPDRPSVYEDICLSYGKDRFTFIEPGKYEIQAILHSLDGTIRSNVLPLWVRYPTPEDEKRIVPTFDDEVLHYLAVDGNPTLTRAERILKKLASADAPAHPLARAYHRCKAGLSVKGFRVLDRKRRKIRQAVPARADFHHFRAALGMDHDYRLQASPHSNLVFSQLAAWLARSLASENCHRERRTVMRETLSYLRGQRMPDYAIKAFMRHCRVDR
jgi:hypothetical protein